MIWTIWRYSPCLGKAPGLPSIRRHQSEVPVGTVGIQAPEERRSPAGQDATMRTDENSSNMAEFYGISKDFYGISKDFYGISMGSKQNRIDVPKMGVPHWLDGL